MKTEFINLRKFNDKWYLAESGGTNDCGCGCGDAWVVAAANGMMLVPAWPPIERVDGPHAYFEARTGLIMVHAAHKRGVDSIDAYRIEKITNEGIATLCRIATTIVWPSGGNIDRVPPYLRPAMQAAREKARCRRCECTHYALLAWSAWR